ncbi:diadenylate cyclase CdaA [Dehalobacter sp. DCM]|uniref:diadenylate cyclase CdaA n=1 Tax=Dehalobacter sp. DCM TaxID=2907827 RepID=UPI00308125A1|nr:diadenylate cyclase CdaA [Dehalobacter sp. DCM]
MWMDAFQTTDIVDIAVVAIIIYQLLMLIKGTRAVQLIKGLFVLMVIYLLARQMQLDTLSWILNKVWGMLLVAIPVVFQPELRRALEQIGRGKFITMHPGTTGAEEYKKLIEELVRCSQVLSQSRIGALIVIEKTTGIQEYIETGVKIDGVVSSEFLVNLFIPKSPLHDGAVIIRGDRVAAAGCFLPLTQYNGLQKDLGTRHRAALGLSEVSDALIIIVSEETGVVSTAKNGKMTRFLDEKSLRDLLKNEILVEKAKRINPFKRGDSNA